MPGVTLPPVFSPPVLAASEDPNTAAVAGESTKSDILSPWGYAPGDGVGVYGSSGTGAGVNGSSATGAGVYGQSQSGNGVYGSTGDGNGNGVVGANTDGGTGVLGTSVTGNAVAGKSQSGNAGYFVSGGAGNGVYGQSQSGNGVYGSTGDGNASGVIGVNTDGGNGVYGTSVSGNAVAGYSQTGNAGYFVGPVFCNGDHHCTGTLTVDTDIVMPPAASDVAEDFAVEASAAVEPGTVMALDANGALRPCNTSYDRKVAGVISGAGDLRPGMILGRQESSEGRLPLALVGKTYCKVDASCAPIEVGDLLTTSPTPGHAMKASDPLKAFGAVIGKALRPLERGAGLIPILIALQ